MPTVIRLGGKDDYMLNANKIITVLTANTD